MTDLYKGTFAADCALFFTTTKNEEDKAVTVKTTLNIIQGEIDNLKMLLDPLRRYYLILGNYEI